MTRAVLNKKGWKKRHKLIKKPVLLVTWSFDRCHNLQKQVSCSRGGKLLTSQHSLTIVTVMSRYWLHIYWWCGQKEFYSSSFVSELAIWLCVDWEYLIPSECAHGHDGSKHCVWSLDEVLAIVPFPELQNCPKKPCSKHVVLCRSLWSHILSSLLAAAWWGWCFRETWTGICTLPPSYKVQLWSAVSKPILLSMQQRTLSICS